jgi:hypothetical protein
MTALPEVQAAMRAHAGVAAVAKHGVAFLRSLSALDANRVSAAMRCDDLLNDLGSRANAVSEVVRLGVIVYGEPVTAWRSMKLLVVVPGCTRVWAAWLGCVRCT